ncbi:hypothetical protein ElP_16080 [Tautonia plasticadhaerens]|uniref:Uncharacterized protein n=1 Tax=Tautonia plasticadhaerens TaxID=2527974 RepID=A0A518GYQ1_9BACT|nr:hypothetical protein ElP_16080 [Tautonia plasticadhaerens]
MFRHLARLYCHLACMILGHFVYEAGPGHGTHCLHCLSFVMAGRLRQPPHIRFLGWAWRLLKLWPRYLLDRSA